MGKTGTTNVELDITSVLRNLRNKSKKKDLRNCRKRKNREKKKTAQHRHEKKQNTEASEPPIKRRRGRPPKTVNSAQKDTATKPEPEHKTRERKFKQTDHSKVLVTTIDAKKGLVTIANVADIHTGGASGSTGSKTRYYQCANTTPKIETRCHQVQIVKEKKRDVNDDELTDLESFLQEELFQDLGETSDTQTDQIEAFYLLSDSEQHKYLCTELGQIYKTHSSFTIKSMLNNYKTAYEERRDELLSPYLAANAEKSKPLVIPAQEVKLVETRLNQIQRESMYKQIRLVEYNQQPPGATAAVRPTLSAHTTHDIPLSKNIFKPHNEDPNQTLDDLQEIINRVPTAPDDGLPAVSSRSESYTMILDWLKETPS